MMIPSSRIDSWRVEQRGQRWRVVDRNGCPVADCGTRRDDAELIVHYAEAHHDMIDALRAALPYLESMYENLQAIGMDFDDARDTLARARTVLQRLCSGDDPEDRLPG